MSVSLIGFRVNVPEGKTVLLCSRAGIPLPSARTPTGGGAWAAGRQAASDPFPTPWDVQGFPQESGLIQPSSSLVTSGVGVSGPAVLPSCRSWQKAALEGQDLFPSLSD